MTEQEKSLYEKMAKFEEACRRGGLKLTHQRLELIQELTRATDHPSAETIHKRLLTRLPTISLDTVYRTLATFEQYGLVKRVQTSESQARFEAKMDQHHHLICKKCGMITDFYWDFFDETQLPEEILEWGRIENKNATLHGICRKCARVI